MYVEPGVDGASPLTLRRTPGWAATFTIPGAVSAQIPNGVHRMGDDIYVVFADKVYAYALSTGASTLIGTVAYTAGVPVRMSDNGTHVVSVSADTTKMYVFNRAALAGPHALGLAARSIAYLDGYMISIDSATNRFHISSIDDATTWAADDYSEADSFSDLNEGGCVAGGLLYIFGQDSLELWQHTGNAAFPFERASGDVLKKGIARGGAGTICTDGATVYFVGDDRAVYRGQGLRFEKVSTPAVELLLSSATLTACSTFIQHIVAQRHLVINTPSASLDLNIETGTWSTRLSYGEDRWRAQYHAVAKTVSGYVSELSGVVTDFEAAAIYVLSPTAYAEGTAELLAEIVTPPVYAGGKPIFFDEFMLEVETGLSGVTETGANVAPEVSLEWSDDNGNTWSNPLFRSVGFSGDYNRRVSWQGLGRAEKRRSFRIRYSHASPFNVLGAQARYSVGT